MNPPLKSGAPTTTSNPCASAKSERLHPVPPDCSAALVIKSLPHDFGSYREVCVRYDDSDPVATDYAYGLENNTPAQWTPPRITS